MDGKNIVKTEFGNWKGPWVIDFNPLAKLTDEEPEEPQMITAVTLVLMLLGTVGGNKHLLFNRYKELFVSYVAEVTPIVRKNSKMRKSKALNLKHLQTR